MLGSPLDYVDPVSDAELTPTTATGPRPSTFELIGARFRETRNAPDWGWNQSRQLDNSRIEISEALRKRGYDIPDYDVTGAQIGHRREDRGERLNFLARMAPDADRAMWAAFGKERGRDPNFLPDYAAIVDLAGLDAHVIERRKREVAKADDVLERGVGAANVVSYAGALGAGMLDPTSYIPVGGGVSAGLSIGRQILKVGVREAAANVAFTAVTEPLVQADAARLGQDRGLAEFGTDLAVSAVLGFTIGAGAKGIEIGAARLPDALFPHLPRSMRERAYARALAAGTIDDRATVAAMRAAGTQAEMRLTPAEIASLATVEANADLREASPFMPTAAGDLSHGQRLAAAIDALLADRPLDLPAVKGPSVRAALLGSTAQPVAAASDDVALANKIIGRESGGNANARNPQPGQTASGVGQFTDATWKSLYRRELGGAGMSDAQILALKTDPQVGRRMTEIAVAEHKAWLRSVGMPITDGNVYLMHFLGPKAIDVLRAAPETPIASILPESWIRANESVLRGKTAGEVIGWTDGKMGGAGVAARAPDAATLRPELFETPAEHAAARIEVEGAGPRETPGEFGAELPDTSISAPSLPDPVPHLPALAAYIRKPGNSLKPDRIAAALGIDRDTVLRATGIIATGRDSPILIAKSGKIMRRPVLRGPIDLLTQIAAWGGLRDDIGVPKDLREGHDLRGSMGLKGRLTKAGPVVRGGGMTVDQLGERLHEAKWFSSDDRPTVAEVLDLIDRAARTKEKIWHPEEGTLDAPVTPGQAEIENAVWMASREWGIEMDQDLMDVASEYVAGGMDPDMALMAAIRQAFDDAQAVDAVSLDGPDYDIESIELASPEEARGWIDPLERYADDAFDARGDDPDRFGQGEGSTDGSGATGLLGPDEAQPAGDLGEAGQSALVDAERLRPFDDPAGDGAQAQTDSIEHDLRMELRAQADPAIAERQRAQAALKAAPPLRNQAEQDGTMGLGLFDQADQPEFRLAEGDDRALGDIFDELDAEAKGVAAIEACMKPGGGADGAG